MAKSSITIVAISGSLRENSSNTAIIKIVKGLVPANTNYIIYNGLAGLPHFNPELDTGNAPEPVNELRKLIKEADGVFICTPEYAFGVPGSLKNMLDWTVSSGEFLEKPVALITASSSGDKAHPSLLLTLQALTAKIPDGGTLLIPFVRTKINSKGEVTDANVLKAIQSVIESLIQEAIK